MGLSCPRAGEGGVEMREGRDLGMRSLMWVLGPLIMLLIEWALLNGSGMAQLFSKTVAVIFFIVWIIFVAIGFMDMAKGMTVGNVLSEILMWLILAAFFIMTSPWWHGIAMFFYINPAFWEVLILGVLIPVIVGILYKIRGRDFSDAALAMVVTFSVFLTVGGIVFGLMAHTYPSCEIARTLDITEIQDLPDMDINYTRIMPMIVSNKFAIDACQYPQYTPKRPPDIAMINGAPYWSYVLIPDGLVNIYNLKDRGAIFVNMSASEKDLRIKEEYLKVGPGMKVTDDVYWQIYKKHYWIDTEKPDVIEYKGKIYFVIPYIKYETKFHFPIWYKVPKWGGVILVNGSTGEISFLSPKEARESPILREQKLFPENLARYYVDSQRYWKAKQSFWAGIWNVWIHHKQEIEITDVSSQGNRQPFLLKTTDGLKWLISTEPYGRAHGIYRVYLIDARTGEMEYKQFSSKEIGPVRAANYVRKSNPLFDWSTFETVEPIPIVRNGVLFWEVRVVPRDGSGIAKISFINSENGDVLMFENAETVKEFLEKGIVSNQTENKFSGIVVDVDDFEKEGNTNWIITLRNGSKDMDFLASAEDLNFTEIITLTDLKIGERVTITYNKTEDRIYLVEKIDFLT